jgi:hypothetical protein
MEGTQRGEAATDESATKARRLAKKTKSAVKAGASSFMPYVLLADALVVVHFAFVAFIVLGQAAILLGAALRWVWVRNPGFRYAHLAAIVFVAGEAVFGVLCPLTVWEYELRVRGGQRAEEGTFIGRWVRAVLYYDLPPWVFTTAYVAFALLVLVTLIGIPPRRSRSRPTVKGEGGWGDS